MNRRLLRRFLPITAALILIGIAAVTADDPNRTDSTGAHGGKYTMRTYTDKWVVIPEWTAGPMIDGKPDEALWKQAAGLDGFVTAFYERPTAHEIGYRAAYGNGQLYIAGRMAEDEANTLAFVEIVLQAVGNNPAVHHVVRIPFPSASPNDPVITTYWNTAELKDNGSRRDITGSISGIASAGGFVTVEASIPLDALAQDGVEPGDEWGINLLHVHRLYEAPLLSWVPIRHSDFTHRPSPSELASGSNEAAYSASVVNEGRLGSVFFKHLPQQLLVAASAPSVTATLTAPIAPTAARSVASLQVWQPEEAVLHFIGFTEKTLSFALPEADSASTEIQLWWQEPGGVWEPVETGETKAEAGRHAVSFRHPAPLAAGMYRLQLAIQMQEGRQLVALLTFDQESMVKAGLAVLAADAPNPEKVKRQVPWAETSPRVESLLALIPEQPGFRFTGLPEMPELSPDGLYKLSTDGQSLIATRTDTVYPNEQFAETGKLSVVNGKGEPVTIPYYEDSSGKRYFITAHLWHLQLRRAISGTETVAASDPLGAARLLYRFAQAYEGYNPTSDAKWFNLSISRAAGPPYSYFGGLWNRWWVNDLQALEPLMRAYRIVKGTDAFEQLSQSVGEDVERKLVEGLFRPSIDQVMTHVPRQGNLNDNNWSGLVTAARSLDEPDYIHMVVSQLEEFLSRSFLSDGFWKEVSPHYHRDLVNGIAQLTETLKGYSDAPGYVSPRTGRHLENLDVARDFPVFGRALELMTSVAYPDGKQLPLQDAWAAQRTPLTQLDREALLLPSARIARLTGGNGAEQTQVHMNFDPKYGTHYHLDPLNLDLYASRQELLPDLGYTHTIYHYFASSTIGHNTVVVDGKDMEVNDVSMHGGNVQAFVPVTGGAAFGLMRAEYASAYPRLETYSREPWFVPFADGEAGEGYVLDLFRVTGGSRHEYTLQGDANRDARFETAMPLATYGPNLLPRGTQVQLPVEQTQSGQAEGHYPGYIYVRDVQQVELSDERYEVTLITEDNGNEQAKLRVTGLLEPGDNELYLGRSPSLRATRLNGSAVDNNDTAVLYDMPKLVLRREGTNLKSTFVTVLEPYRGSAPRIETIERLPLQEALEGAVAVRIVYGNTTDILLSNPSYMHHSSLSGNPNNLNNPNVSDYQMIVDDIVLRGETGFIRMVDGEVREMHLIGGALLKKGDRELNGPGLITGKVHDTLRLANGDAYDALVTDAAVGEDAVGRYVIVTQSDGSTGGFEIGAVRRELGRTLLVLAEQEPGFEVHADGMTQQIFYPQRRWDGAPTFRIANIEHAVYQEDGAGASQ